MGRCLILGLGGLSVAWVLGCGQVGPEQSEQDKGSLALPLDTTGPCAIMFETGGTGAAGEPTVLFFREGQVIGRGGGGPVYSGTTDTELEQAVPTQNDGTLGEVTLKGGAQKRHGLIRWDLSYLSPTTVIQDACINLVVQDPSAQAYPAYEVLRNWSEASATWNVSALGTNWEVPGAWGATDSGTAKVAQIPANKNGNAMFALSKELVQRWVSHPEQNHGVLFGNNLSNDGISFFSSEDNFRRGPELIIRR